MITQARLKECLDYDPNTGIFTLKITRHGTTRKVGDPVGSLTDHGYLETCIDQYKTYLHRFAFLYMTGEIPSGTIDHKNRIKTDNRWENLRIVTQKQNVENNIAPRRHGSLGVRGVYRFGEKFRAKINSGKKQIHLGTYSTIQEAANAYMAAKPIYHAAYEE